MPSLRPWFVPVLSVALLSGCVSPGRRIGDPELIKAEQSLKQGRFAGNTAETRAGYYLDAAARSNTVLDSHPQAKPEHPLALSIYNAASAELTALLRDNDDLWKPLNRIPAPAGNGCYQLRLQNGQPAKGIWSPALFTDFQPASKIKRRGFRKEIKEPGYGGTLVGVRKTGEERTPKDPFAYRVGKSAPVTATLDFKKPQAVVARSVTLTLNDPSQRTTVPISGAARPLAADFTAPLAWYPQRNEFWAGLMAMTHVQDYLGSTGLYMLRPYDPERIPVIFIHGLASTPQMWLNVINEIEGDPLLRRRFQYWVYWYPTGNPLAYSALQLRKDLATAQQVYGLPKGCVIISHSMGGLLARMQSTTPGRTIWDANLKGSAEKLYRTLPNNNVIKESLIFEANPKIERLIFICVPHRGSELAIGTLGELATRFITLPLTLVQGMQAALGSSFDIVTGGKGGRHLTSIQSLSPRSNTLLTLDKLPIQAPYHSIIGDRGRNDSPNSSDGVVPYWSSNLKKAESELIVPGPHGSYQLSQTVEELRRILSLHIAEKSGKAQKRR